MAGDEPIFDGLWAFSAIHPEWEDETDGWEPEVRWWAYRTSDGLLLIDPLVADWAALDALVEAHGGCAGVLRTTYWHDRSTGEAAERYGTQVWTKESTEAPPHGVLVHDVVRDDEVAVWLPGPRALVFGDVVIRRPDGRLSLCPESWMRRDGGLDRLRAALRPLVELEPADVLVSHGPLVLGDGTRGLREALAS